MDEDALRFYRDNAADACAFLAFRQEEVFGRRGLQAHPRTAESVVASIATRSTVFIAKRG